MKKIFMALAAVTLIVTACSNDEILSRQMIDQAEDTSIIGFIPTTGKVQTKATDLNLDGLKATDGFKVVAYHMNEGTSAIRFTDIYKYDTFSYTNPDGSAPTTDGNGKRWGWSTIGDDKKWPIANKYYPMNFYAYYPADLVAGDFNITFTPVIAATAATQKDMLVATNTVSTTNDRPAEGKLVLTFDHILSRIEFKLNVESGYNVELQSVKIVNVAGTGRTYSFAAKNYTGDAPTKYDQNYLYKSLINTLPIQKITGAGSIVDVLKDSEYLMLLPQETTLCWDKDAFKTSVKSWVDVADAEKNMEKWNSLANLTGSRIELVYAMYKDKTNIAGTLIKTNDGTSVADTDRRYVRVGYPLNLLKTDVDAKAWVKGNAYTYTINLGSKSTNGTIMDPYYKDENGVDKELIDKPGQDITSIDKYIDFDVTVSPWNTSTGGVIIN